MCPGPIRCAGIFAITSRMVWPRARRKRARQPQTSTVADKNHKSETLKSQNLKDLPAELLVIGLLGPFLVIDLLGALDLFRISYFEFRICPPISQLLWYPPRGLAATHATASWWPRPTSGTQVAGLAHHLRRNGCHQLGRGVATLAAGAFKLPRLKDDVLGTVGTVALAGHRSVEADAGRPHGGGDVQRSGVGGDEQGSPASQGRQLRETGRRGQPAVAVAAGDDLCGPLPLLPAPPRPRRSARRDGPGAGPPRQTAGAAKASRASRPPD